MILYSIVLWAAHGDESLDMKHIPAPKGLKGWADHHGKGELGITRPSRARREPMLGWNIRCGIKFDIIIST